MFYICVNRSGDKGSYTCRLPRLLAELGNTSVSVHILNKTLLEPITGGAETFRGKTQNILVFVFLWIKTVETVRL